MLFSWVSSPFSWFLKVDLEVFSLTLSGFDSDTAYSILISFNNFKQDSSLSSIQQSAKVLFFKTVSQKLGTPIIVLLGR